MNKYVINYILRVSIFTFSILVIINAITYFLGSTPVVEWSENNNNFVNTNKVVDEVISLPMHTELTYIQIKFICEKITGFLVFIIFAASGPWELSNCNKWQQL